MELWPAFVFGFLGSAHCAAMCGPLALALPVTDGARVGLIISRLLYNLGRIITYGLLGAVFGLLGRGFAVAGFQRWVSIGVGAALLISLVATKNFGLGAATSGAIGWLKNSLGALLRRRTFGALLTIGVLNGFLPCGLVYWACATAITIGDVTASVAYMIAFGLGTLPVMFAISLLGQKLQLQFRLKLQKLVPFSLALVGVLLLLRGLGLDIPYLSPAIADGPRVGGCCHH